MPPAITFPTQTILPWNELLSFTSVRDSGNVITNNLQGSRYPIKLNEVIASGGVYTASDIVFTISLDDLSATPPKPGDLVTVNDTPHTVLTAIEAPFLKFHRLIARNLILAFDLRQSLSVSRPANTQTTGGLRNPALAPVAGYQNLPCRVQETQSVAAADSSFGSSTHTRAFTIFVNQRLALKTGDVLTVAGVQYDFQGSASWDRIDQLGEIRVYRIED